MRRLWVLLLAAALLLAGCKRSEVAQNLGPALQQWDEAGEASFEPAEPSEIVDYQNGDFAPDLGFSLTDYPGGNGLTPAKFFAIDGWFGQVEFHRPNGNVLVVRVARTTSRSLRTTYTENHSAEREDTQVDGIAVTRGTSSKDCHLITWERGDFQYTLHTGKTAGMPTDEEIEQLVRGLDAELQQTS